MNPRLRYENKQKRKRKKKWRKQLVSFTITTVAIEFHTKRFNGKNYGKINIFFFVFNKISSWISIKKNINTVSIARARKKTRCIILPRARWFPSIFQVHSFKDIFHLFLCGFILSVCVCVWSVKYPTYIARHKNLIKNSSFSVLHENK